MKNQIKYGAFFSGILFVGFICLYISIWVLRPNQGIDWSYISLGKYFHIAVTDNWRGNLVLFNQDSPYTGSIIKFTGDKTIDEWGLTGWGIYFRHITNSVQHSVWWTLIISLWYPIIIFGILPAIFVVTKLRCKKLASKQ
jgi:hypothetical protein